MEIIPDQVSEPNCGVITDRVRDEIIRLARQYPDKPIVADSRARIGAFRSIMLKPNEHEAARAILGNDAPDEPDRATIEKCGRALAEQTGRPVFVTIGAEGILVYEDDAITHVPGIRVTGPIDIVGAGDSALAGLTSALCSGATPSEAALVGNLVASITVQQIGTTGTASPGQVLERLSWLQ